MIFMRGRGREGERRVSEKGVDGKGRESGREGERKVVVGGKGAGAQCDSERRCGSAAGKARQRAIERTSDSA